MYYILKTRSVIGGKRRLVGWSLSLTGFYPFCSVCQPALKLECLNFSDGFEEIGPQSTAAIRTTPPFSSHPYYDPCPLTPFHPHSLTRHSGIRGPYREFALLSTRDHATRRGGHSSTHGGGTPIPLLHSHFLFVYNIAKHLCSSKARCITLSPFFYNA